MTETERFLITLASGVDLFRIRGGGATDQKKSVLRILSELSGGDNYRITVAGDRLRAQGRPVEADLPGVHVLLDRCRLHNIAQVRVTRGASEADLLLLMQSLAAEPDDWVPIPEGGTVTVVDVDSVLAPAEVPDRTAGGAGDLTASQTADAVNEAIDRLEQDPLPPDLLHQLGTIVSGVAMAFHEHRNGEAVQHLCRLMALEQKVPNAGPRRNYGIAFRRLLGRTHLPLIAETVDDARYSHLAGEVVMRAGVAGAEALIRRLENSRDVDQSARYVQILTEMPESAKLLVPLLSAPEWTVACGAAQLLGEFHYEKGVDALGAALDHTNSRVRQTAVAALTRIGTTDAVVHVQRALSSTDDGMRSAVARNVGGRRSGALAMPLLKVAEEEHHRPEVLRDCYVALGMIGTQVAVQALMEATKPGGRFFGKKTTEERLAALEGLKLIRLPIAQQRLFELMDDRDRAVREAAQAALHPPPEAS